MNLKLETCRSCPVQCALEDESGTIIKDSKKGKGFTVQQIRSRVSNMNQQARRIGCPSYEINRVRAKTYIEAGHESLSGNNLPSFFTADVVEPPHYFPQSDGTYVQNGKGRLLPTRENN